MPNRKEPIRARRIRHQEGGGVIVFLAVALVPLLALIALSVDGYSLMVSKLEQENNAEFAAIAALNSSLDASHERLVPAIDTAGKHRAELIAGSNRYIGNRTARPVLNNEIVNRTAGNLESGFYDRNRRRFSNGGSCGSGGALIKNAVKLSLNTVGEDASGRFSHLMPIFARLLGHESFSMRSSVIAYRDSARLLTAVAPRDAVSGARNIFDINGDGAVSSADYDLISVFLSTPEALDRGASMPASGHECFDLDGNGVVNLGDLSQMQQRLGRR